MTNKMKIELFEKALEFENKSIEYQELYEKRPNNITLKETQMEYFDKFEGAYEMLKILGLDNEYIEWAEGK